MNDMNNNDNVDKSQAQPVIDMRDTDRRAALFKRIRRDHSLEIAEAVSYTHLTLPTKA